MQKNDIEYNKYYFIKRKIIIIIKLITTISRNKFDSLLLSFVCLFILCYFLFILVYLTMKNPKLICIFRFVYNQLSSILYFIRHLNFFFILFSNTAFFHFIILMKSFFYPIKNTIFQIYNICLFSHQLKIY